jgi:hypothetical protein
MSVKLLILKSLEDVIADVTSEDILGKWYELSNPYVTRLDGDKIGFYPYIPLSKETTIKIPSDWVVTMVDPIDEVAKSYLESVNAKPENSDSEE